MREKGSIEAIRKTIEEIEEFLGETPFTKEMKEKIEETERKKKLNERTIETKD